MLRVRNAVSISAAAALALTSSTTTSSFFVSVNAEDAKKEETDKRAEGHGSKSRITDPTQEA